MTTLQRSALHLDLSTRQGPRLNLGLPGLVFTTGTYADPGLVINCHQNVIILNNIVFNLGMQTWHFHHFLLIKFYRRWVLAAISSKGR
jgi:hypothetical protein